MRKLLPERICGKPINIGYNFISLNDLANQITEVSKQRRLPVCVQLDQAKQGSGVSSLFSEIEPCLVVYHPNHKNDYYNYMIVQRKMNGSVFLFEYQGGKSSSFEKRVEGEDMGGVFGRILQRSGKAHEQEEYAYYDMLNDVIAYALVNLRDEILEAQRNPLHRDPDACSRTEHKPEPSSKQESRRQENSGVRGNARTSTLEAKPGETKKAGAPLHRDADPCCRTEHKPEPSSKQESRWQGNSAGRENARTSASGTKPEDTDEVGILLKKASELMRSGNYIGRFPLLLRAAELGNATAQNELGSAYLLGCGIGRDYKTAVDWFRQAAAQGMARAYKNLAYCYQEGFGVSIDPRLAMEYYQKAAQGGIESAIHNYELLKREAQGFEDPELLMIHVNALQLRGDYNGTYPMLLRAAELGNAEAQNELGVAYMKGYGTAADYGSAVTWFRQAAAQGEPNAIKNLGYCYQNGLGIPRDENRARSLYRQAKEKGAEFEED